MSDEIEQTPVKSSTRFPWGGIGTLFSTFSIIVIIVAGYFTFNCLTKSQAQLAIAVTQLQQSQSDLTDTQKNINSAVQSIQPLQDEVTRLKQTVDQFSEAQQDRKNDFAMAEANYYVKLANDNLQYGNNIALAINLLKAADSTIQSLADPKLDNVRKALASDLANLQAVPQVDVTGIYMRLIALNNQIDKLPLVNKSATSDAQAPIQTTPQSWWKQGLQSTWQALQKIVVVRYNQNGTLPLVTPEQQVFLYQNLHAMLEEAIWGLLHGQNTIYQTSLQQTNTWVKEYFIQDSSVTQAMLTELTQLQQINIHPANPTITDSVQAFQSVAK